MNGDLSIKGVLRQHLGLDGNVNVMADAFPLFQQLPEVSLRSLLELTSRQEIDYTQRDNCLSWRVHFEQTWTHIRVRVQLNPANKDAEVGMNNGNLKSVWKTGIESTWNGNWTCRQADELACRLSFEVIWVEKSEHYKVKVDDDDGRSNMTRWDIFDSASVVSHEFGHMIGNSDEYADPECELRDPVETGSVMDDNTPNVPERIMTLPAHRLGTWVTDLDGRSLAPF
jgi:hypothetical protein